MERHRYKRIATTLSNKLDSWLNRFNHEEDEKISEEQENVPEIITEPNLNFYENPKNTALEGGSCNSLHFVHGKKVATTKKSACDVRCKCTDVQCRCSDVDALGNEVDTANR